MSYKKRLDRAFENAPLLPVTTNSKYVFFSDFHRGVAFTMPTGCICFTATMIW